MDGAQDTVERLANGRFPPSDPASRMPKPKTKVPPSFPKNLAAAEIEEVLQGMGSPPLKTIEVQPHEVLTAPPGWGDVKKHLDSVGIDRVCEAAESGLLHPEIARSFGVGLSGFYRWVRSDPARARAFDEAQKASGDAWMARGLDIVMDADDALSMAKAREVITHCRKMAAIRNPRYSDKIQVEASIEVKDDPDSINARLGALLALAKPPTDSTPDPA